LDTPLAVVVQSGSAAGKSTLVDAVLSLMPPEQCLSVSAMTGQSLFYLGETELAHKVLSVAEADGASRAAYPLRLLQSEGELSIASTGKDRDGGLVTRTYRSRGPVALFLTTTAPALDDELANRCIVVGVDEDLGQTRAILAAQREAETLGGLLARRDRDDIRGLHANAQRLLEPVAVVNPLAPTLTFADGRVRARRDQAKYLTLIRAVTLLHQHQLLAIAPCAVASRSCTSKPPPRTSPWPTGWCRWSSGLTASASWPRRPGVCSTCLPRRSGPRLLTLSADPMTCVSPVGRLGSTPAGPTSPCAATWLASSSWSSSPSSVGATPSPTHCCGTTVRSPGMTREAMGSRWPFAAKTFGPRDVAADAGPTHRGW
jgi:hypothetical protein